MYAPSESKGVLLLCHGFDKAHLRMEALQEKSEKQVFLLRSYTGKD